ncbi:hypothetical protein DQ04_01761140 [Trypanosoma grayi]|uniref:hypothetical protein n=1 Tax=Trypanosoma grayi TaxID=71804 RepID=UPI0004F496D4|nr:hypothetical protein DQ04_01761140 [Trypanosoma grayi]KEG12379.1 hypothetical protein DQ04_01761140 [Trypanosoma grayi]
MVYRFLHEPLEKRRDVLKDTGSMVRKRLVFSELVQVEGFPSQQQALLQRHFGWAIAKGVEGLVIKDLWGVYEPGTRQ